MYIFVYIKRKNEDFLKEIFRLDFPTDYHRLLSFFFSDFYFRRYLIRYNAITHRSLYTILRRRLHTCYISWNFFLKCYYEGHWKRSHVLSNITIVMYARNF